MAGIYVHIPFCRQACRYCDFYFTVSLKYVDAYVGALCREIESRYFDEEIETVYFGGGTPSVLNREQLERILSVVAKHYSVSEGAELTLEANPDDLDHVYLGMLSSLGFNRLSIGIQSFHRRDLELMRRSHSVYQASRCLEDASGLGFTNINVDLIYGIPGQSLEEWEQNLGLAMKMPIQHLSAYHLTIEEGTVFDLWKKKGRIEEVEECDSIIQYRMLNEISSAGGFEHYEISNFAKSGMRSRHNTSYWKGVKYLGVGAGAHSYDGNKRRWNVASVKKYIDALLNFGVYFEEEKLSLMDRYHDHLLTALRTSEGVDLAYLEEEFGMRFKNDFLKKAGRFLKSGEFIHLRGGVRVSEEGWLKGDMLVREMMIESL